LKNIYAGALFKHPIFEGNKLKNDLTIKNMFDFNAKLIQEFIIREGINEHNWDKNDDDFDSYEGAGQKDENGQENENKTNEKENEENHTNQEREFIADGDSEVEDVDLDELQSQYALLLLISRFYKIGEHIILKFYLYHTDRNGSQSINGLNFMDAVEFLKKKNIIEKEDEEQSVYLLKQFVQAIEEDFLYQDAYDLGYSFLSEDLWMTSNISFDFLNETIDNLKTIVHKIYNV
jgi:hypothetical protein